MNDKIHESTEQAQASSRMVGTVLFAVLFVCFACILPALLILSVKAGM